MRTHTRIGSRAGVALLLVGAAALLTPLSLALPSRAASCDVSWASTSTSGDWDTNSNWSTGFAPTSTENVCLPAGSYTVTVSGESADAASVTVGAGVTLEVIATGSSESSLTLSSGSSDNSGTIELTDSATSSSSQEALIQLESGVTLSNDGTILSDPGPDAQGTRVINGASSSSTLDNAAGGTITVNQDLQVDPDQYGVFTTDGSITIPSGEKLLVDPSGADVSGSPPASSATFNIEGGTITDDGTFAQGIAESGSGFGGGTLNVSGGTITGAGLDAVDDGGFVNFSGAGSGTFTFEGRSSTTMSGTIGSSDTVSISATNADGLGGVTLAVDSNVTNDGTLELTDPDISGPSETAEILIGSGDTLTNDGTIVSDPGPDAQGTRVIDGASSSSTLDNASDGTITVNQDVQVDQSQDGVFTTSGHITIAAGEKLLVDPAGASVGGSPPTSSATFNIDGGTITDDGTFAQGIAESGSGSGGGTLNVSGGTITGPASAGLVATDGDGFVSFNGHGGGTFTFEGAGCGCAATLSGTIGSGDTVKASATTANGNDNVTLAVDSNMTNDGTLELTDPDTTGSPETAEILIGSGDTLTNDDTILSDPGGAGLGTDVIDGSGANTGTLDNAADGTITVNQALQVDQGQDGVFTTDGAVTVASGVTLFYAPNGGYTGGGITATPTLDIAGGTITDNGAFDVGLATNGSPATADTALNVSGGTITGNPIVANQPNASLSGAGSGAFTFVGAASILSGTIGTDDQVTLDAASLTSYVGGAALNVNSNVTNDGTLTLTNSGSTGSGNAVVDLGSGDTLTNSGTFTSATGNGSRQIEGSGDLVNSSTGVVDIRQSLSSTSSGTLTNDGTWIMEPDTTLTTSATWTQGSGGTFVTWVDPNLDSVGEIDGPTSLAGTLEVKTLGAATASAQYTLASGTVTGTFPANNDIGPTYSVAYGSSSVTLTNTGNALAVGTTSLPNGELGQSYSQTFEPSGGTSPYTWSISSGSLPAGLSLNTSTGAITGTASGPAGTSNFTVKLTDSSTPTPHNATEALSITINSATVTVTTGSLPGGQVGVAYNRTLQASGGTTPYTWSIVSGSLPAGLSLDASTGAISGTPTGPSETADFTVEVTDSSSPPQQSQTQALSITIAPAQLQITTSSLPNGQVGVAYSQTLGASGGTTSYSWSISSGSPPAGLSLNGSSGAITGTPTGSGTSDFTVKVIDSGTPQQSQTQALSITIAPAQLQITTSSLPNGQVGVAYSQTLGASGGTTSYSWSISSGSPPAGLSLNGSSGAITGTPTGSGTSDFTVKVIDSGTPQQSQTQALSITIAPAQLQITTSSLPNGQVGVAYSQTLGASGGTTSYSWSISSGSPPAGLSLNGSSGAITGTPTGSGTSDFTVKVIDSGTPQQSQTQALSITIAPARSSSLSIGTASLPPGTPATAYSQPLAADGGTPPYSWSIASGSLPAGLSLNGSSGAITGTPTTGQTASFTVKVTDSGSPAQTVTRALSIVIASAYAGFDGVSCPSAGNCTAVGTAENSSLAPVPLAEGWSGSGWSVEPTSIALAGSSFTAVSCPSASVCEAVGSNSTASSVAPLAERWNGSSWSAQSLPAPAAAGTALTGVSCPSASWCMAVGSQESADITTEESESWNGSSWTTHPMPLPAREPSAFVAGVSCVSSSDCEAIGSVSAAVTLAEHWNGSSWAIQTTPNPSGSLGTELQGVSCASGTSCTAVGWWESTAGHPTYFTQVPLAEHFNGSTWSLESAIPGDSNGSYLTAVSCPSARSCTAVGSNSSSSLHLDAFVESWNGSSWSIQTTPNPSGSTVTTLSGVSCTSSSTCTAVGTWWTTGLGAELPFAERFNGSSWSLQSTPNASVTTSSGGVTVTTTVSGPGTVSAAAGPPSGAAATVFTTRKIAVAARAKPTYARGVHKHVTKAGTIRLKLALNAKARALLRKHGKLPVEITLTFKPKQGRTVTTHLYEVLVVKHKKPKHHRKAE